MLKMNEKGEDKEYWATTWSRNEINFKEKVKDADSLNISKFTLNK